jgi:hypothetical protein
MGRRQREWAKRGRAALVQELGGRCVDCGCTEPEELELDHIKPCEWARRRNKIDQSMRLSQYRRDAKEKKLTVRCRTCNASKSNRSGSQRRLLPSQRECAIVRGYLSTLVNEKEVECPF